MSGRPGSERKRGVRVYARESAARWVGDIGSHELEAVATRRRSTRNRKCDTQGDAISSLYQI